MEHSLQGNVQEEVVVPNCELEARRMQLGADHKTVARYARDQERIKFDRFDRRDQRGRPIVVLAM